MRPRALVPVVWIRALALLCLALAAACARPQADPWPGRVREALQPRVAALSEEDRRDYEEGFSNGASMVERALHAGVRPYRPLLDTEVPRLDGSTAAPAGAPGASLGFHVEVDLPTGLVAFPATGARNGAFARGQVEGFTWALGAIGQGLVRPVQVPPMPDRWVTWRTHQRGEAIQVASREVRLHWSPGLLAWTWRERGFPAQRGWRAWEGAEAPAWVGASGQALWIETPEGQALALDLASGGVLALRPAVPHAAAQPVGLEAYQASVAREFASPAFQQELVRLRAAAESGAIADFLAVAKKLGGMGEDAEREAFGWYLKAAEKGSPEAMLRVGVTLFHGGSVPADKEASKRWLDRASQAGHPLAAAVKETLFGG